MSFHVGDLITIEGAWTNSAGSFVDPGAVFATYQDPSGNAMTLQYGVDADLVLDSTGVYQVDIDADEAGRWQYRFYSTGAGQASSGVLSFIVLPVAFASVS